MSRLLKINPADYHKLDAEDECYYIGEYTAGGGYQASATNQSILNLKKKPTCTSTELRYKQQAVRQWGDKLAKLLNLPVASRSVTFVPAPSSKMQGHPDHDDRMLRVLQRVACLTDDPLDVRPVLYTQSARPAQHDGERLQVDQIRNSLGVNKLHLKAPLREVVIVVDDVFTQGGTFKAMQGILMTLPNTKSVAGIFLAKTVWPVPFGDGFEDF